jgi:hypothetical protein
LTSRICAAVILIIFCSSPDFAIQHCFIFNFSFSIEHLYQADQFLSAHRKRFTVVCYFIMTRQLFLASILICNICLTRSSGQTNTNDIFEQAKGTLLIPIASYKQIIDMDDRRHAYTFDRTDSSVTFITDSACEIKASYGGVIKVLFDINDSYTIGTKFGDYFIIYSGLSRSNLQVGDSVQAGQIIGRLYKEKGNSECELWFSVQKMNKSIDAYKWLKQ